jgi:hypothetical protein
MPLDLVLVRQALKPLNVQAPKAGSKRDEWCQTGSEPPGVQVACGSSGPGHSPLECMLVSLWNDFRFSLTHIDKQACVYIRTRVSSPVPSAGREEKRLPELRKDIF